MAGVVGVFTRTGEYDQAKILDRMLKRLSDEAIGSTNSMSFGTIGLSIAWPTKGHISTIPVWNREKDVGLLFIGEDFSEVRVPTGFPAEDTTALRVLAEYERSGSDSLSRINGCFYGLIIDRREHKALLFNERYGLSRIYFHETANRVFFASEAKALLSAIAETREIDLRSFGELLSTGCTLQNRTLFRGIFLLPGGARWTFSRLHGLQKDQYFQIKALEGQTRLEETGFYGELKRRFTDIGRTFLQSNGAVAMSLTGGLDCRILMAAAHRDSGSLPCYTFTGSIRNSADFRIARRVANICNQPHSAIRVGSDFFSSYPELVTKTIEISDGTMDVTGSVELYVNAIANRIAPIRITGNYGSEIVRGNVAFSPSPIDPTIFDRELVTSAAIAEKTYTEESRCHPTTFIAFKQVPWHHFARYSIERSQLVMRSPFLDNALLELMYRVPISLAKSNELALRYISDLNPGLARIPTDRGLLYKANPLASVFRNSYAEFTAKAEYAYDYGMPQWLARADSLLSPLRLENIFLGRHKFYHFRRWYRHELADHVKAVLLDPKTLSRSCFLRKGIEKAVSAHLAGVRNYTTEITQAMSVELIFRGLLESN